MADSMLLARDGTPRFNHRLSIYLLSRKCAFKRIILIANHPFMHHTSSDDRCDWNTGVICYRLKYCSCRRNHNL